MKILKQGAADWWAQVDHECRRCGAVYLLEAGDKHHEQSTGEFVTSDCPTCGALVQTWNPNMGRSGWTTPAQFAALAPPAVARLSDGGWKITSGGEPAPDEAKTRLAGKYGKGR